MTTSQQSPSKLACWSGVAIAAPGDISDSNCSMSEPTETGENLCREERKGLGQASGELSLDCPWATQGPRRRSAVLHLLSADRCACPGRLNPLQTQPAPAHTWR